MTRVERYQETVKLMNKLEEEGRVFVFRPTLPAISKFEKNSDKIMESYHDGYSQADEKILDLVEWTKTALVS